MTTALILGRTVKEAESLWRNLKKKFPQHKNPYFISRNPEALDGVNPSGKILILLPGYSQNPIVKHFEFQWLKDNAIEVIHINSE
ncbi:hypothetical protein CEY02_21050 [Bacillus pumilus]|uniref:Uncharacterized protein n=1 Tax=Bacillus pumilus TaxID=1408 RepID=A0A2A5IBS2_BACPU|nr:hypothetical protein CEY02_21050 [Bacillus pumilus]